MPGNELGDRVHNFFAQDNASQGQHQSHVLEGNWPVPNNFWVANQRQIDVLNSTGKNYAPQNSDIDRGPSSYPVHATHGFNFPQSNQRHDFSKSQSLNEQQYSNGSMYGNQFYQTRQNEANFLAVDTDSDQRHLIASTGLTVHELQQGSGHEQQAQASDRSETSVPPLSFDLFGGQQQMSHQQASMLQAFQRQQSGLNNMHQLQQQLMIRKMQELQRQQQLQQLDFRPQNLINQVAPFTRQVSGIQPSTLVNGTPSSDALQYPWMAEPGTNWLSRGSSAMQGSSSGLVFPTNLGQTQRLMDLVPQQVDQSLYGVPVSSSRGLAVNQYSQMVTDRTSMPQIATSSSSLHSNQHNFLLDQIGGQEDSSISRQKLQNENIGHASSQSLNTGKMDMGDSQQVNFMHIDTPQQDFLGRQELTTRSETFHKRSTRQTSSSPDEVALDPTEEKILYGSDDNIWAAFGKSTSMSGEAGNLFDNGGLNGLPSIQSGRWSALMQSAVAETSSTDVGLQEEWSGSHLHNIDGSSANQRVPSALSSRSFPSSDDLNKLNVMGSKQLGGKFRNEPGQLVPTDTPQRFGPSLEEAKWSNHSPLQKTVAEDSQIYRNASQHSLYAERNAKTISATWAPGQSGTRQQSNGWNALAAVSPGGDRALNVHEAEELPQNSQNNQSRVMQGEVLHGSSLWKSNSEPSSATEDPVKSTVGNQQANKGVLSLNDATASVANSCNMAVGDGSSPFVQSNYVPSQWKNAFPSVKQGVEGLGRMLDQVNEHNHGLRSLNSCDKDEVTRREMESCAMRENSSDSHHSNLSQHASGGFRESGLSGANDSTSLPQGKQKSTNQLARKVPLPRKFQYHPMGNLDEDVEPTYGQQPTHVQAISMQNTLFGQSKLIDQVSRNSKVTEKGELQKDNKVPDQEPSRSSYPGYAPSVSSPFSRPSDSCSPNNASSPSQNMLELLHKVDQSRDHGAVMHLNTSECNASSQLPEAEKFDGSAGRLQRSQSSLSQGFGLQLGPPSQRLQPSDQSSSSLYKTPGNYHPELSSGTPYGRSQLQTNQITMLSGKRDNASLSIQGGSAETVLPNASRDIQKDNLFSSRGMAQQTSPYDVQDRGPAATASTRDHMHRTLHFHGHGISPQQGASGQVLHGMWTNVPTSQHTLGAQYSKVPPHFSELPQPDIVESNSQGNLVGSKGDNLSSKFSGIHANSAGAVDEEEHSLKESTAQLVSSENIDSAQKMVESLGKASSIKNQLDNSPANSASTQKDIEAFGRSLKPSNLSNEKYALLNQMRALRDAETDPSTRVSKRIKGPDNVLDGRQVNLMAWQQTEDNVRGSLGSTTGVPSEDSRMLSFPTSSDMQRNTSTNENVNSQDVVAGGLHASQSNPSNDCTASLRVDQGQVSPQMAPSWFNQYGSFKNEQLLPMYNAHKGTSLRSGEPPFTLGRSSSVLDAPNSEKCAGAPVDACRVGITLGNSAPTSVANEYLSSPQSLQLNVTGQHQVILRPKKRKSATSELHPWYKEISNGSQSISTLSVAEADWNRAANRLTEKVEDDSELIEDGTPLLRSKRRLILTTQLMQQLFSPPPATILSADASSAYESVTYTIPRVLLRDACSTVSHSSDLGLPSEGVNLHPIKGKLNGNPRFAKVAEELLEKARRLENDFLRLDKSASILDLRVECQDLEKFSVINRFAKFHGRAQTDNADTASTDATASMLKPCAQRYVTAVQMPRSLPERVQCLSL